MKSYYQDRHARTYNRQWRIFSERTLAAVLPVVEQAVLFQQRDHHLRILDIGCGTGLLLEQLAERFPDAELSGVDASSSMLEQAQRVLGTIPHIHLAQAQLALGESVSLPFAPASFDIITCTNTLHYFSDPVAMLRRWRELLDARGHLVIEDYTLRNSPVPWNAFEGAIKLYDPQHVRLHQCSDAQSFSQQAGFHVLHTHTFPIDFLCQGWVVLLEAEADGSSARLK